MPRYIKAEELKHLLNASSYYGTKAQRDFCDMIMKCDTADVRENIRAQWLKEEHFGGIFKCSNCDKYVDFRGLIGTQDPTYYCPNCGADMRERGEDVSNC